MSKATSVRKSIYIGKSDTCKCGDPKLPTAKQCRKCWIKEVTGSTEKSYCQCGLEKTRDAKRCFECKLKEEHKDHKYYWSSHDFCGCGRIKSKESPRCRKCSFEHRKNTNRVCRECGVVLTKDNETTFPSRRGERICMSCTRSYRKARYQENKWKLAAPRIKLKREVMSAYGGKCQCCQEQELSFLSIDHINNDGAKHRKTVPGNQFYKWLKLNGFPSGYRVLCHNCNIGRHINGGVCPHQQQREATSQT